MQKESLTAYRCNFISLVDKQQLLESNIIVNEDKNIVNYGFEDLFQEFSSEGNTVKIDEKIGRILIVNGDDIVTEDIGDGKKFYLTPKTGKYGAKMTLIDIEKKTEELVEQGKVAVYQHSVFLYETDLEKIIIFHRKGGSGCKCILQNSINKIIKDKGIKMELNLIVPKNNNDEEFTPTEIIVKCVEVDNCEDRAEKLYKKKKSRVYTRQVKMNLSVKTNVGMFQKIKEIFSGNSKIDNLDISEIVQIDQGKEEVSEAIILGTIGKTKMKFSVEEFENSIGELDITEQMKSLRNLSDFDKVNQLSDNYYKNIGI